MKVAVCAICERLCRFLVEYCVYMVRTIREHGIIRVSPSSRKLARKLDHIPFNGTQSCLFSYLCNLSLSCLPEVTLNAARSTSYVAFFQLRLTRHVRLEAVKGCVEFGFYHGSNPRLL